MPSLNFGGNKNKHFNWDPDPLFPNVDPRIRILIHYSGKVGPGSGSTFPKCGSQDPDPRQNEMDPKRCF